MTTQQQECQQAATASVDHTEEAMAHAETTVTETIGGWPACACPHHRGQR